MQYLIFSNVPKKSNEIKIKNKSGWVGGEQNLVSWATADTDESSFGGVVKGQAILVLASDQETKKWRQQKMYISGELVVTERE